MRLSNEELNKIKEKYGVETIWSWSRLEKARQSKNEYYLQYIRHLKEDRQDCVYSTMGGLCHDSLEKLYEGQIEYDEMTTYFNENWIAAIDIMDLKFDRNDSEKNRSIASKYKENLEHFFEHHNKIPYKVICEQFILTLFDKIVFQGYADAIFKDDENNYHIIDFKTSTKYSASGQKEKCGQLVCYALGLHQKGIQLKDIKIAWNFLKYVTIQYEQANGKIASKDVERREIGSKLITNVKMWLKKLGYEDKIDEYVDEMVGTNSIECLPDDVRCKYKISDCYVYVDLTQDLIDYWTEIVKETVTQIEHMTEEYNEKLLTDPTHADEVWFDSIEDVEKESYYYANLSGYSGLLNKSYGRYLDYLESKKNGGDLFGGVGSDLDDNDIMSALFGGIEEDNDSGKDTVGSNSVSDSSPESGNGLQGLEDEDLIRMLGITEESSMDQDELEVCKKSEPEEVEQIEDDEELDMSWLDGLM